MERAGIPVPGLQARDGLAAINGSNLLTAMSAIHIYDMERFLKQAEIAAAMSIEALLGNLKPYNTRLHEVRGFNGAIASANPWGAAGLEWETPSPPPTENFHRTPIVTEEPYVYSGKEAEVV